MNNEDVGLNKPIFMFLVTASLTISWPCSEINYANFIKIIKTRLNMIAVKRAMKFVGRKHLIMQGV